MNIKNLSVLRKTIFHPQWLVLRQENLNVRKIVSLCTGKTLDIGCADQKIKSQLNSNCEYIGLDYLPTAEHLYETSPMIFADGRSLPVLTDSIDTVLLTDVLEHIPDPLDVLKEIQRTLKPRGRLILTIPFLYPIHDAPYDYQRLTRYGLRHIASKAGLTIEQEYTLGSALTTACLLGNISVASVFLDGLHRRHPAVLLGLLLPVVIPVLNILGWMSQNTNSEDNFMPHGYMVIMKK